MLSIPFKKIRERILCDIVGGNLLNFFFLGGGNLFFVYKLIFLSTVSYRFGGGGL